MSEPSHGCCEQNLDDAVALIGTTAKTKSGASPRGDTPLSSGSYEVTWSKATDVVAPAEALSINSRPLLALRAALHKGEIAQVLRGLIRQVPAGARQMKQVTPAVREQLVADYQSGLGIYEVGRKHGLHRYTVAQHLTAAGVVMRRTITEAERARAHEMYLAGATYAEIARQLRRDPATIKRMIRNRPAEPSPNPSAARTP
ncbi:helix-turn-helix domain-containing protein [Microbacterium hominis]|uniref:helix-turn-helix domain-containing protein n=1 Tax=Microbacterium hominis TaxID=162426 RepID=UPI0009E9A31A|nr:helix-turn-helix domain-containing protein [Microbacterium hominis]